MSPSGGVPQSSVVRVAVDPATDAGENLVDAFRTAASSVPVVETGPTGVTALEPLVLCTHEGRTAFHADPDVDDVDEFVDTLESDTLPTEGADAVVEHDPDTDTLPVPRSGPLAVGTRRVLGPCGWVDPEDPAAHDFLDVDTTLEPVADSGLLGRGRGDAVTDEPVFEEWTTARDADGESVVVVNANDADDRSLADETLLAGAPYPILDAAVAVAEFVDASDVVVYCNEADDRLHERLRRSVDAAREEFSVVPQVVTGPDTFRAGEETMALEAMEGTDRIEARVRPPGPAEYGLYGRPTVVHSPRTFAQVYRALVDPDSFDPDDADPGTRLVTVTGDVDAPATVELPTGRTLADATDAVDFSTFETAVVGGQFGGLSADLDVSASAPALRSADLGTNGVVELLDDSRCVVAEVGTRARFASEENCGRCVPCREGSKQLVELLRDVYDGEYDADGLRELAGVMRRSSTCDFGVGAARPVATALDEFEPEFRAHANGRCPSGTCEL
ncbi:NADH-ubiquinone oxidoreductase-F iron-sulfur binding region domain-containing protein [Halospeciosus flavus]|uniref:NADH-ubiquinone oxidoreductase-F iron-sulfur binding region domain-containing protein n=1 Tax=Halospeciosus flavus TaxID=3032283 RepID=A0ABD5Z2R1_9EURY|nr:NADH-ubiquinone oxidoreductase-F iron-sulfur binding region domain-containing protein [Halospeciosus flavus]